MDAQTRATDTAPQWATELYQLVQTQSQRLEFLEQQLRERRNGITPTSEGTTSSIQAREELVQGPTAVRTTTKNKLPELPEFSGKRVEFRPWLMQVKAKLAVDKSEETESVRFWYVHSRLRGDALSQTSSWVDYAESTQTMTVDGLITQLRVAYDDNETAERASRKLNQMRQGSKSFSNFLAEFDRTLLDAGGLQWADQAKKAFLSNCLSYDLQNAIVATPIPSTYREYCTLLHTVSTNLEILQRKKGRNTAPEAPHTAEPAIQGETMDWEPATTVMAAARTQRAQWVSQETLEQRRRLGQCFRCGGKDYSVRRCVYLPAVRPQHKTKVIAATSEEQIETGKE
jgi:hypothetical protein